MTRGNVIEWVGSRVYMSSVSFSSIGRCQTIPFIFASAILPSPLECVSRDGGTMVGTTLTKTVPMVRVVLRARFLTP